MRLHIFVDAENISTKSFFDGMKQLRLLHSIAKVDVFAKEMPQYLDNFPCNFIKCFYGKNSADTFLAANIVKALYEEPLTDGFAIFSGDTDFAPVIKVITDAKKPVIVIDAYQSLDDKLKELDVDMRYFQRIGTRVGVNRPPKGKYKQIRKVKIPISKKMKKLFPQKPQTVFLMTHKIIYEIPFFNGISIQAFTNDLPITTLLNHYCTTKLKTVLEKNYLKIEDNRVYIDLEKIYSSVEEEVQ